MNLAGGFSDHGDRDVAQVIENDGMKRRFYQEALHERKLECRKRKRVNIG